MDDLCSQHLGHVDLMVLRCTRRVDRLPLWRDIDERLLRPSGPFDHGGGKSNLCGVWNELLAPQQYQIVRDHRSEAVRVFTAAAFGRNAPEGQVDCLELREASVD